jgi:hypothetical protein
LYQRQSDFQELSEARPGSLELQKMRTDGCAFNYYRPLRLDLTDCAPIRFVDGDATK